MSERAQAAEPRDTRGERALGVARVGGLAIVLWAVSQQLSHFATGEAAGVVLATVAAVAWLGWLASRRLGWSDAVTASCLAAMAAAGGVLTAYAPIALCFVAVAALGAAVALELRRALWIAGLGVVSLAIAVPVLGAPYQGELLVEGVIATAAGLLAGLSRRQYQERASQAEELLEARVRADAERDVAAALAERNRLGRELHDVLAHSLGALTVQLDAADAMLERGRDEEAHQLVRRARSLASDGLTEAREAVHALRGGSVGLVERLRSLAAHEGATLDVEGSPREPDETTQLALYRAAQESLTNARKHAPGGPVAVRLGFGPGEIVLTVENGAGSHAPPAELRASGGGHGLRGMRERVEQVGGTLRCGPSDGGWSVRVTVPA